MANNSKVMFIVAFEIFIVTKTAHLLVERIVLNRIHLVILGIKNAVCQWRMSSAN
jgi:hypothetical protein